MAIPLFLSGSTSDDFELPDDTANPLLPCPDSPNCVRVSKKFETSRDIIFKAAKSAIKKMGPVNMKIIDDPLRINAVFKAFIFKDDFVLLVESKSESSTVIHIRSSSRIGHGDLGVNRRRVKKFLRKLDEEL